MKQDIQKIAEYLELLPVVDVADFSTFESQYAEYTDFLLQDSLTLAKTLVSKTHLLIDSRDNAILAYMSLSNDSITLTKDEKSDNEMETKPFTTFPALKVGKLSVDKKAIEKYAGIGSFLLKQATAFAYQINSCGSACRFITVDADIQSNPSVTKFYEKNGFILNERYISKKRLTVSMRKDIYKED